MDEDVHMASASEYEEPLPLIQGSQLQEVEVELSMMRMIEDHCSGLYEAQLEMCKNNLLDYLERYRGNRPLLTWLLELPSPVVLDIVDMAIRLFYNVNVFAESKKHILQLLKWMPRKLSEMLPLNVTEEMERFEGEDNRESFKLWEKWLVKGQHDKTSGAHQWRALLLLYNLSRLLPRYRGPLTHCAATFPL